MVFLITTLYRLYNDRLYIYHQVLCNKEYKVRLTKRYTRKVKLRCIDMKQPLKNPLIMSVGLVDTVNIQGAKYCHFH